jgi:hypothetical protein
MNQTNAKDLTLTALEARNLQADIFELLTQIASLTAIKESSDTEVISIDVSGGEF